MSEHDWQPIAEEDPSIMCNVCFECKCCSDWTDECPGEWVPEDDDFMKEPSEKAWELVRKWREGK